MQGLLLPLEVIGALLLLAAVLLLCVVFRRRWLGRDIGAFDCSLRTTPGELGKGWRLGLARYHHDRIEWFRVFDLSLRPRQLLLRSEILVQERRIPQGVEALSVMTGFVIVRCDRGDSSLELAMSDRSYTGFASWLESAPPGQNVSVA
ncbi:MAG: DUF2550 domain-containing protein [Angustibacter sp.]